MDYLIKIPYTNEIESKKLVDSTVQKILHDNPSDSNPKIYVQFLNYYYNTIPEVNNQVELKMNIFNNSIDFKSSSDTFIKSLAVIGVFSMGLMYLYKKAC